MKEINALEKTKSAYIEYGSYVNSYRSIPDARDGLKVVQRRILCTLKDIGNMGSLHSCPSIEGTTLKQYHPHGSAYGPLVNMINDISPLLKGMGNFGADFRGFLEPVGAAASRYTKAGLSDLGINFIKFIKFSETFINENDNEEPSFIPTAIPYCLMNGSDGMGIGCATSIPSFKLEDLQNMVRDIILENPIKKIIPYFGGGETIISPEELDKLHSIGVCSLVVRCKYEKIIEKNEVRYVINDVPKSIVNLSKIKKLFKDEILNKEIIIKNEIQSKIKIVVIKTKKCKIAEEKFEERLIKSISGVCSFNILASEDKIVKRFTPEQLIRISVKHSLKAYSDYLNNKLSKLEEDRFFIINRDKILEIIKSDLEKEEIKNLMKTTFNISIELVEKILSKTISSLISSKKDINNIENEINNLKNCILDIKNNYLKDIFEIL